MTTFKEDQMATSTAGKLSLAQILEIMVAGRRPLRFTAYDGSVSGPEDALGFDLVTPAGHHLPGHRTGGAGAGPRVRGGGSRAPRGAPG